MTITNRLVRFVPATQTVNTDRAYHTIGEDFFVKDDTVVGRGQHEADVLRLLKDLRGVPRIHSSYVMEDKGLHRIVMSLMPGKTVENILGSLTPGDSHTIIAGLLEIYTGLLCAGVVHGDINVSNVLYDKETKTVSLIDFETATIVEPRGHRAHGQDLLGPPWGILDLWRGLP